MAQLSYVSTMGLRLSKGDNNMNTILKGSPLNDPELNYAYVETPVGFLEIAEQEQHLKHIYFVESPRHLGTENETLTRAKLQLGEYIQGKRTKFDLPLAPRGTDFQQRVWQTLCTIEYGGTCSYLDIATQLGQPNAVRAVGAANGKNPISIVVPCHRVIGKSGKLTGYAGGLSRKAWLLELETRQNTLL